MAKESNCGSCRFSHAEGRQLLCRRYPPNSSLVPAPIQGLRGMEMQIQNMAAFTPVKPEQWCGEFALQVTFQSPLSHIGGTAQ